MTSQGLTPESLGLQPHPEGGWFRETWRSPATVGTPYGERALATAIAFLLSPGERSTWHRVRSEELWLWQAGGELVLDVGGRAEIPRYERSVTLGVGAQHLVGTAEWQQARPAADAPVLVACVVSPGFDFADFELALPDTT